MRRSWAARGAVPGLVALAVLLGGAPTAAVPGLVALAVLLGGAPTAAAHPTLLFTEPAADTAVTESPTSVALVFSEPVSIGRQPLALVTPAGQPVALGEAATAKDGRVVTAAVPQPLQPGNYLLRWRVTGADGDVVEGEVRFAVGAAMVSAAAQPGGFGVSWPVAALRWVLFAGLAVALGGAVAGRLTAAVRAEAPSLPAVRSWALPGALAGLAAALGLAALLIRDTGSVAGPWLQSAGRLLVVQPAASRPLAG